MPKLSSVDLPGTFEYDDVTVIGGIPIGHILPLDIGDLCLHITNCSYEYCMKILDGSDEITELMIANDACSFEDVTIVSMSVYPKLKTLRIGNNGFEFVDELNITGLNELEIVVIGDKSFPSSSLKLKSIVIHCK